VTHAPRPRPGSVEAAPDAIAAEALDVLDAALVNPAALGDRADALLRRVGSRGDVAEVWARRAVAITHRDGADVERALDQAQRATDLAHELGATLATEADCTLALCLLTAGDGTAAMATVDRAVASAPATSLVGARARVQRALILHRRAADGWDEDYAAALPVLRAHGDTYWEGLALLNRGTEQVYRGDYAEARTDLARALDLHGGDDVGELTAVARHNLGFASARTGDLPAALSAYAAAAEELEPLGVDMGPAVVDRAEALVAAGLVDEATRLLDGALPGLHLRTPSLWPEAVLLHARALLAAGHHRRAADAAARATEAFREQDREGWELLARTTLAVASAPTRSIAADDAVELADRAAAAGWVEAAVEVRAAVASAIAHDAPERATALLDGAPTPAAPGLVTRLALLDARIALATAAGDHAAVLGHADRALADLAAHRDLLGASELQATASRHAQRILSCAAASALDLDDLDVAMGWVDRLRAQALDHPPVVPPEDAALAADLGRLRGVVDALVRARAGGDDVASLEAQRAALERRVRDRTRTAKGAGRADRPDGGRSPGTTEVTWLDRDGRLVALVADDAGTRRVDVDLSAADVVAELDALGFAMQRVGRTRTTGRRRDLAARSLGHSLHVLDAALVAPLALPADGPVVVSPTSVLFDVPWSGLASLVGRAVAVTPALRLARRPRRGDGGRGTVLLEGPRLDHAAAELRALAGVVDAPRLVLGDDATVATARTLLPPAAVAHLACHGVFRADNPQFSSLELADGPVFVYDLEALPRVPPLLVLSACQTGRAAVHATDELLGVSASLLAMGARHVVAALADVPDDLSAVLMVAFHRAVADGASPAVALARARRDLLATHDEPAARLTAAAFTCLGAP
jgi:tetratricopeptide (TPR) repeat protein